MSEASVDIIFPWKISVSNKRWVIYIYDSFSHSDAILMKYDIYYYTHRARVKYIENVKACTVSVESL